MKEIEQKNVHIIISVCINDSYNKIKKKRMQKLLISQK